MHTCAAMAATVDAHMRTIWKRIQDMRAGIAPLPVELLVKIFLHYTGHFYGYHRYFGAVRKLGCVEAMERRLPGHPGALDDAGQLVSLVDLARGCVPIGGATPSTYVPKRIRHMASHC